MRNRHLLIDSFIWLEIVQGSEKGKQALEIMDGAEAIHTSVVNLYEVSYRLRTLRDEATAHDLITTISSHAIIHPVDREIALAAAPLRLLHGYGAVDALYHATAEVHNLEMLTGDQHFRDIERAILI
ncbi:MAG TPA: PIN domain-containing protein [Methanolinea sp.]|nr:PIN domain-containing protein [Methanolinea sp.]